MLQSTSGVLLKATKQNQHDLDKLSIKMQYSIENLESIKKLLNQRSAGGKLLQQNQEVDYSQERLRKLTQELDQVNSELILKDDALLEKTKFLQQVQQKVEKLQFSLDSLSEKYNSLSIKYVQDIENWQRKYYEIKSDYEELLRKNQDLEDLVSQLQELHKREIQRKDQLELLQRENAQEQKIITQGLLERDQKIDEFQQNLKYLQQELDEKDELLEVYINKPSIDEKDYKNLQDKIDKLKEENYRCKRRLDNLNELYHHKEKEGNQQQQSFSIEDDIRQSDDNDTNKNNNRIPVLSSRLVTQPPPPLPLPSHDHTAEEFNRMKEDLLVFQEKLVEKISQNRELENAMERVNEHCQILRTNLNETREESSDRYKKMLMYMEENRILKEQLLNNRKNYH